jgi:hypothetical protein
MLRLVSNAPPGGALPSKADHRSAEEMPDDTRLGRAALPAGPFAIPNDQRAGGGVRILERLPDHIGVRASPSAQVRLAHQEMGSNAE